MSTIPNGEVLKSTSAEAAQEINAAPTMNMLEKYFTFRPSVLTDLRIAPLSNELVVNLPTEKIK
jgi:hypothetical protein